MQAASESWGESAATVGEVGVGGLTAAGVRLACSNCCPSASVGKVAERLTPEVAALSVCEVLSESCSSFAHVSPKMDLYDCSPPSVMLEIASCISA
jgi:hypothetical protein